MKKRQIPWAGLLTALVLIGVLAGALAGLSNARTAQAEEARQALEDSLRRAAVTCYSIEGAYPDTLEKLTGEYGVYLDEERYSVHYQVFASNIVPEIVVLEK